MNFMAEFNGLDKGGKEEVDLKTLLDSRVWDGHDHVNEGGNWCLPAYNRCRSTAGMKRMKIISPDVLQRMRFA